MKPLHSLGRLAGAAGLKGLFLCSLPVLLATGAQASLLGQGDAGTYPEYLPEETLFLMHMPNVPRMRENFTEVYGDLINRDKLERFFAPLERELAQDEDFKAMWPGFEEKGLLGPIFDVLDMAQGEAAMAVWIEPELIEVIKRAEELGEMPESVPAGMVMMAEINDEAEAAVAELWSSMIERVETMREEAGGPDVQSEEVSFETRSVAGAEVNLARISEDGRSLELFAYAVREGHLVAGAPASAVMDTLERMEAGGLVSGSSSLAGKPRYLDVRNELPFLEEKDLLLYIDLADAMSLVNLALIEAEKQEAEERAEYGLPPAEPDAMTPRRIVDLLGVNGFDSLFIASGTHSERSASVSGLLVREKTGLLELLQFPPIDFEPADFVPDAAVSYAHLGFDFNNLWEVTRRLVREHAPDGGQQFDAGIDMIAATAGISVPRLFQDGFGNEIVALSLEKPEEAAQVSEGMASPFNVGMFDLALAIELRDKQTVELAISNGIAAAGVPPQMIGNREYLGTDLNFVPGPGVQVPQRLCWFMRDQWLFVVVGSLDNAEAIVAQIASERPGPVDEQLIAQADRYLPTTGFAAGYDDLEATFENLFSLLETFGAASDVPMDFSIFFDSSEAFPYYSLSRSFENENGYISRAILFNKREKPE
jgi:hypothetical protein